jgi:small-conductance mechanosensitive channel
MRALFYFIFQFTVLTIYLIVRLHKPEWLAWESKHVIFKAILNFVLFWMIVNLVSRFVRYYFTRKFGLKKGEKDNIHYGINNITKVLIAFAAIFSVFGAFGIEIKEIVASLSIVAAAIAIIAKDFVFDFLVGLYFSFSEDFDMGDHVKINNIKGKIVEIGLQRIKFQNEDDDIVIIPNSKIYNNEIINYTKRDLRLTSIDFQLDINRIGNIESLEKELIKTLKGFEQYIEPQTYNLKVLDIKKDYIDFKFLYRIHKLDSDLQKQIRKKTIKEVFNYISKRSNPT